MDSYKIGDLVQVRFCSAPSLYHRKLWQDKVGVITGIRDKANIAYINWTDPDLNSVWIECEDLVLLNRE